MLRNKKAPTTWKEMRCQKSWDSQFSWTCHLDLYTTDMPLDSGAPSWSSGAANAIDMYDKSCQRKKPIFPRRAQLQTTTTLIEKLLVSLILAQGLAANFASGHVSPSTILIITSTVQHNEFLSLEGTEMFVTFLVPTYFIISNAIIFNVKFVMLMMSWYYIYFPVYEFHFFNHYYLQDFWHIIVCYSQFVNIFLYLHALLDMHLLSKQYYSQWWLPYAFYD